MQATGLSCRCSCGGAGEPARGQRDAVVLAAQLPRARPRGTSAPYSLPPALDFLASALLYVMVSL